MLLQTCLLKIQNLAYTILLYLFIILESIKETMTLWLEIVGTFENNTVSRASIAD